MNDDTGFQNEHKSRGRRDGFCNLSFIKLIHIELVSYPQNFFDPLQSPSSMSIVIVYLMTKRSSVAAVAVVRCNAILSARNAPGLICSHHTHKPQSLHTSLSSPLPGLTIHSFLISHPIDSSAYQSFIEPNSRTTSGAL